MSTDEGSIYGTSSNRYSLFTSIQLRISTYLLRILITYPPKESIKFPYVMEGLRVVKV